MSAPSATPERQNGYELVENALPRDYQSLLDPKTTQIAISKLKRFFEDRLCSRLNLFRIESPLIMETDTGMTETVDREQPRTPVRFRLHNNHIDPMDVEITQAATKWKRWALKQFDCRPNEGILTDMRAVRQDEFCTTYHSAYVDQWDWEKVIAPEQRTLNYLTDTVKEIWEVIKETDQFLRQEFPALNSQRYDQVAENIEFVHSEQLCEMYPEMTPDQRETEYLTKHPAIFIYGIGMPLQDGNPHGTRTGDYDDWITPTVSSTAYKTHGLNGDIVVWNSVTRQRHELSSMAIRVTKESLAQQMEFIGQQKLLSSAYHQMILNDEVPLCVGGGIGVSRTYMYLLRKAALGECSVAVWPRTLRDICTKKNIHLLK